MKTRFKRYGEFLDGLKIARMGRRCVIYCGKTRVKLFESPVMPWNSNGTKNTFLARLYIERVLWVKQVSPLIQRVKDFELLGTRCKYRGSLCVICNSFDAVDPETGEVVQKLTLYNDWKRIPFTVNKNLVKL